MLVGHDWGGWIGWLLTLREPRALQRLPGAQHRAPLEHAPHVRAARLALALYQPLIAFLGVPLMRRTRFIEKLALRAGTSDGVFSAAEGAVFGDSFRRPVCARAARDTYRTFLLRELPAQVAGGRRRVAAQCRPDACSGSTT